MRHTCPIKPIESAAAQTSPMPQAHALTLTGRCRPVTPGYTSAKNAGREGATDGWGGLCECVRIARGMGCVPACLDRTAISRACSCSKFSQNPHDVAKFNNVKTIWQVVQSFSASATKTTNHQSDSKSCAPHATPSISQHTTAGTMSGSKHDKDESAGMNQVRWVPRVQAGACDGAHRRHGQPQHRASFVQVSKIVEEKQLNQERVQEVRVP